MPKIEGIFHLYSSRKETNQKTLGACNHIGLYIKNTSPVNSANGPVLSKIHQLLQKSHRTIYKY